MNEEEPVPGWLDSLAYEGALFGATQFVYGQSIHTGWMDMDEVHKLAGAWKSSVLEHYKQVYHDATTNNGQVPEVKGDDLTGS